MSAPQRPTPADTARLRTGGDCLRHANRLFKSAGIAHGQGFVNAEEESLTLMGHATGLAWEQLPSCFERALTAKEKAAFHWGVTPAGRWSLFDLATDPKCDRDLSKAKPDLTTKLAAAYDKWWDDLYPTMIEKGGDKGVPEPLGGTTKE